MIVGSSSSTANLISTASAGSASTQLFIGNSSIDVTVSDARLKNVIGPTTNALAVIDTLPIVDFVWNSRAAGLATRQSNGPWVGMVAQDLYGILPQYVVKPTGADTKTTLANNADVKLAAAIVAETDAQLAETVAKQNQSKTAKETARQKRAAARVAQNEASDALQYAATADSNWSINYQYMVPLAFKGIQELQAEIVDLKARIAALEAK